MRHLFGILLLAFVIPTASAQKVIYVDVDANGAGNGTSWANAYRSLQDALRFSSAGDEIWVAAGRYFPDRGLGYAAGDVAATFNLKSGVRVFGGFTGQEVSKDQRNYTHNETILSGNIGNSNTSDDNSYQVVTAIQADSSTAIDGFIIEEGNARGTGTDLLGAGVHISNGHLAIHNSVIRKNKAVDGGGIYLVDATLEMINVSLGDNISENVGGGIDIENSHAVIIQSKFIHNTSEYGGGLYARGGAEVEVIRTEFHENTGDYGGAVRSRESTLRFIESTFRANIGNAWGAGINDYESSITIAKCSFLGNGSAITQYGGGLFQEYGSLYIWNSIFSGNKAEFGGGVYSSGTSTPHRVKIINSTFANNVAEYNGGGAWIVNPLDDIVVFNSIFSNNQAQNQEWRDIAADQPVGILHSLIRGDLPRTVIDKGGRVDADPLFVNALGLDGIAGTSDDDLRVSFGSFAIDAGTNAPLDLNEDGHYDEIPDDRAGRTRIWSPTSNQLVDIGAYEYGAPIYVSVPSLLAANGNNMRVELEWTLRYDFDVRSYRVFRSTVPNASTLIATVPASQKVYSDVGLVNGQTYYYRLKAVDALGNESTFSNEVNVTPYGVSYVQFINAGNLSGDLYVNTQRMADDFEYTGFLEVPASVAVLSLMPSDLSQPPRWSFTRSFGADTSYYVLVTANANSNDGELSGDMYVIPGAKRESTDPSKVDIVFLHGDPGLARVSIIGSSEGGSSFSLDVSPGASSSHVSVDPSPTIVWIRNKTTDEPYGAYKLDFSNAAGQSFAGIIKHIGCTGCLEPFVLRYVLDANGNAIGRSIVTDIESGADIPSQLVLRPNFPNPFNPATSIQFGLPTSTPVTLSVFDVLGREVAVLVNGKTSAGWHEVQFDASRFASGIYFYQLKAGNRTITNKMLLMK